ncbi:MAG: hypothetical protein KDB60_20150, partial [Propionibacteriaceae bacterium]|nr:hypothetical protein [Propionibacteriaceae bacterium]
MPDPLGDLLARYGRGHTVFTAAEAAAWLGIGAAVARDVLRRLVASGRLVEGDLRPPGWTPPAGESANHTPPVPEEQPGEPANRDASRRAALRDAGSSLADSSGSGNHTGTSPADPPASGGGDAQFCDARVLRLLRRRSLAALREAVEPVSAVDYARFLPAWQGVGELRGVDGVLRAVEQLAGVPMPASALESLVLPARVR